MSDVREFFVRQNDMMSDAKAQENKTSHYVSVYEVRPQSDGEEECMCEGEETDRGSQIIEKNLIVESEKPERFRNLHITSAIKMEQMESSAYECTNNLMPVQRNDTLGPFMCTLCHDHFPQAAALRVHIIHHELYKCNLCRCVFDSTNGLMSHLKTHKRARNIKCIVCDKEFRNISGMRKHMMEHPPMTPYGCGICTKQFGRFLDLQQHIKSHPQCSDLLVSGQYEHNSSAKPFKCSICIKTMQSIQALVDHAKSHEGTKAFVCLRCGTQYSTAQSLNVHVVGKHHKDEPYGCNICSQQKASLPGLCNHLTNHSNLSKKKECVKENVYFCNSQNLGSLKEQVYKCMVCGLSFCDSSVLDVHITSHKELHLYKCLTCDQSFRYFGQFKQHVMSHKWYECCVCGKNLRSLSNYQSHLASHLTLNNEGPVCQTQAMDVEKSRDHYSTEDLDVVSSGTSASNYFSTTETPELLTTYDPILSSLGKTSQPKPVDKSLQVALDNSFDVGIASMPLGDANLETNSEVDRVPYGCGICGMRFENLSAIWPHMKLHEPEINECLESTAVEVQELPVEEPLKCNICDNSFSDVELLLDHYKYHEEPNTCECTRCGKQFANIGNFKIHAKKHAKPEFYGCNICKKQFTRLAAVEEHAFIHRLEAPYLCEENYNCTICGYTCNDLPVLDAHVKTHPEWNLHKCVQCGERFPNLLIFEKHLASHERQRPFQCSYCKRFYGYDWIRAHIRLHTAKKTSLTPDRCKYLGNGTQINHDVKSHTCAICGKTFSRYSAYKVHVQVHADVKPLKYSICSKEFTSQAELTHHIAQTHEKVTPAKLKSFQCNLCSKQAVSKAALWYHMKKAHKIAKSYRQVIMSNFHENGGAQNLPSIIAIQKQLYSQTKRRTAKYSRKRDSFECVHCKKRVRTVSGLRIHYARSHSKACFYCGKVCSSIASLIAHERGHRGEVPYLCTCCNKAFATSSLLRTHRLKNSKVFKCGMCHKKTETSMSLGFMSPKQQKLVCTLCSVPYEKLKRTCAAEWNEQCRDCGQLLPITALEEHKKYQSSETYTQCCLCIKGFTHLHDLKMHMDSHF